MCLSFVKNWEHVGVLPVQTAVLHAWLLCLSIIVCQKVQWGALQGIRCYGLVLEIM